MLRVERLRHEHGHVPPDHLAINPRSPHFDQSVLERGIGIRFKGNERRDVEEYSMSEGWIRVQLGKKVDRHGQPLTIKLTGPVEAWYQDVGAPEGDTGNAGPQDEIDEA